MLCFCFHCRRSLVVPKPAYFPTLCASSARHFEALSAWKLRVEAGLSSTQWPNSHEQSRTCQNLIRVAWGGIEPPAHGCSIAMRSLGTIEPIGLTLAVPAFRQRVSCKRLENLCLDSAKFSFFCAQIHITKCAAKTWSNRPQRNSDLPNGKLIDSCAVHMIPGALMFLGSHPCRQAAAACSSLKGFPYTLTDQARADRNN
jgi:hypothetical protein